MAQFVVRNIEAQVKSRMQRRAKRHGRSMEEDTPVGGLGTEIASLFTKIGLDADIPELRGNEVKPTSFD